MIGVYIFKRSYCPDIRKTRTDGFRLQYSVKADKCNQFLHEQIFRKVSQDISPYAISTAATSTTAISTVHTFNRELFQPPQNQPLQLSSNQ